MYNIVTTADEEGWVILQYSPMLLLFWPSKEKNLLEAFPTAKVISQLKVKYCSNNTLCVLSCLHHHLLRWRKVLHSLTTICINRGLCIHWHQGTSTDNPMANCWFSQSTYWKIITLQRVCDSVKMSGKGQNQAAQGLWQSHLSKTPKQRPQRGNEPTKEVRKTQLFLRYFNYSSFP